MSTVSTMTLPSFDEFPDTRPAFKKHLRLSSLSRRLRIGPPAVPDATLLSQISKLASPATDDEEPTTASYAAAMGAVRQYAEGYKTVVPQRSVESVTTDETVFGAQGAWAAGLHDTAVASARYLESWVRSAPSKSNCKTVPRSPPTPEQADLAYRTFEAALQATVRFYTSFLEHEGLPPVLKAAVEHMEANLATAARGFDGIGVVLKLGALANDEVKRRKLKRVPQAVVVYDMLSKLADAVTAARDYQARYDRSSAAWDTTLVLVKVRLALFSLAVTMCVQFTRDIRLYLDTSEEHQESYNDEHGRWADTARAAFVNVVDLLHAVADEYGVEVLTVVSDPDEDEEEETTEEVEADDYQDENEIMSDSDSGLESDDDSDSDLTQTLLCQLLSTYTRFREVMDAVWGNMSSERLEWRFDAFLQPLATDGSGWTGWRDFGVELCRGLKKAELDTFFNAVDLDGPLHARWRKEQRAQDAQEKKRLISQQVQGRSVSTKRPAHTDDESEDEDEASAKKRRKSSRY